MGSEKVGRWMKMGKKGGNIWRITEKKIGKSNQCRAIGGYSEVEWAGDGQPCRYGRLSLDSDHSRHTAVIYIDKAVRGEVASRAVMDADLGGEKEKKEQRREQSNTKKRYGHISSALPRCSSSFSIVRFGVALSKVWLCPLIAQKSCYCAPIF